MKNKALLLALTTTAFALGAQAQSTTFGIRAGVNLQNINGKEFDGDDTENKVNTGFHAGVNAEVPVAPDFYVQPGVLFSTKGAKVEFDGLKYKANISYIEVPINFLYKPTLGTGKLLLGVGPYIAFGIGGKLKEFKNKDLDIEFEKSITAVDYLNKSTPYAFRKRFDAGGNLLFGYELASNISIQLNAQLGMVKTNSEIEGVSNDKTKHKNTGFGASLGYRF